jgi:heterodisulfide reductase subunit C
VGKVTGFKEYTREMPARRPVAERVHDYFEVYQPFSEEKVRVQGARCMDCGIPFCHTGCPVNNIIPDWNDHVYRDRWKEATASFTRRIISRSLPGASAPLRAKRPACWESTSRPSRSS